MKKRILALLLVLSMLVSVVPAAFAVAPDVAKWNNNMYTSLQDAIDAAETANAETIVIDLLGDATLDITAWDHLAIGGTATKAITINGNDHTLTFNHKNSDWNNVATNNNAKLILNDMTIDNSGCNDGPWNRHDINFACDVELNDVISLKALAFKAGATLTDVSVTDTGDVYAIWVQANGQTVAIDGLTVDAGRGIKIDEQYVTAQEVDLTVENATFKTETKAAIVVKSAAGAEIIVNNVDISNVVADSTNIVWVDEDSADDYMKVTVNGNKAALETAGGAKIVTNYVSLGDSMANGYCFEGYRQGNLGAGEFLNGEGVYGEGAYPLQFEEWLEEQGNLVNHTKLAPSAMRAEDLNYLLGGRDEPTDGWQDQVNGYTNIQDDNVLKPHFQNAVTNADIITMGVGNASFGAYMLHRVTDALGILNGSLDEDDKVTLEQALVGLDEEQKSIVLEVYNTMMAQLKAYVPAELAEQFHVEDICNIVAYTVAGFILNYEGSLEQIVALNPDVEVILVGLMNTTYGMEITGEGVSVPVGDIMDEVFGALNAYIAALPAVKQANGEWADATFYYAEQPNPKFISQEFDTLKNNNWGTVDRLDGQTVRERNISAYNDSLREIIGKAFSNDQFRMNLPEISLDDVKAFEQSLPQWTIAGKGFIPNGLAPIDTSADEKNLSIAIYLAIEGAVADSTDTLEIPLESLIKIATDIGSVFSGMDYDVTKPNTSPDGMRAYLENYLTETDVLRGMCKIYALFKVGNGMSVHPTPAGHDEIADAVIAAYENGYTAEDATKDNIEEYAKKAIWLLTEYYDEIYALAYDKADEQGYVAASVAALEYVKAQIAAIDVDALELSDAMKAELKEEAALAMEAIEALQNLLLTADELDDETVKAAQALLDDLTDALENMNDILAVAGTDLESAVKHQLSVLDAAVRAQISAAIERAETALENLKKYIDEDIAPAVRAEIEELIETIEGQLEYLQAVVDGTVEATIDQINKALAALEQAVTDLIKTAQNEADQLLQAMLDELKALAEATVAEFEAALYEATHISMSIYDDQYYVSLGGATANGAGVGRTDKIYSDLVVEALEAEGIDVEFKDLTKADLAYDGLVDYVKANAAEIAKATLITYNMDASGFLMSLFGNDPDWSAYFDEAEVKAAIEEIQAEVLALQSKLAAELDAEALAALAQAEDDVLAALTEKVDVETARELQPYAEKLLYAAVSYAVETAKALEAIQTINPEAEIMLVGMYNPLAGTTVTVKGEVINLGEIVEYAMEATDLYHLIYAVANDKVAFVDVSETTVDGLGNLNVDDPKTMINSLAAALMNASAKISANAAGHAYIAEQIIGAIDFVGMLGDINLDGEVDTADAVAAIDAWLGKIALNELQKNNGDVNFDGTVDAADAALIVDFWLGKIQSFEK